MGEVTSEIKKMGLFAIAAVVLAITTVLGIVLLERFKVTPMGSLTNTSGVNTTIDNFITGLAIFGSFMSIIALALVGKIIMGLFRTGN